MKKIIISKRELEKTINSSNSRKEILDKLQISQSTFYSICSSYKISAIKPKFNENYFENIDSERKAYWLGFIFADGCVSEIKGCSKFLSICLSRKDREHLELFSKDINSSIKIHDYHNKHDFSYIRLYSDKISNDLIKLGCTPRKSLILQYPILNKNMDRHFIRGYFDGDGCVSHHNNGARGGPRLSIIGSEIFLDEMQNKLHEHLGIKKRPKLFRSGSAYKYDSTAYSSVKTIMDWLYKDSNVFLSRKRNSYLSAI